MQTFVTGHSSIWSFSDFSLGRDRSFSTFLLNLTTSRRECKLHGNAKYSLFAFSRIRKKELRLGKRVSKSERLAGGDFQAAIQTRNAGLQLLRSTKCVCSCCRLLPSIQRCETFTYVNPGGLLTLVHTESRASRANVSTCLFITDRIATEQ